jgi:hypothetical protein
MLDLLEIPFTKFTGWRCNGEFAVHGQRQRLLTDREAGAHVCRGWPGDSTNRSDGDGGGDGGGGGGGGGRAGVGST